LPFFVFFFFCFFFFFFYFFFFFLVFFFFFFFFFFFVCVGTIKGSRRAMAPEGVVDSRRKTGTVIEQTNTRPYRDVSASHTRSQRMCSGTHPATRSLQGPGSAESLHAAVENGPVASTAVRARKAQTSKGVADVA